MKISEASSYAVNMLESIYEKREALNITRILFKDLFGISNLKSVKSFYELEELNDVLKRLCKAEPIQYVTGLADFFGYQFKVNHHVLIPRPETEELVHWILTDLGHSNRQMDILDIGAGSGCIGLVLKKKNPLVRIFGIEYSLDALNVARINSRRLSAPVVLYNFNFLEEQYWEEMGKFDIIISNPPYITMDESRIMADNVLLYEPEMALFPGEDPLVFYKAIKKFAETHLQEGGAIYVELHEDYADDIASIFKNSTSVIEIRKDLQGKQRMMKIRS